MAGLKELLGALLKGTTMCPHARIAGRCYECKQAEIDALERACARVCAFERARGFIEGVEAASSAAPEIVKQRLREARKTKKENAE